MEPSDLLPPPGAEPPPGPDELRSIVLRAGRRRFRLVAGGVALALAAGAGVGYGVSQISSHPGGQTVVAGSSGTGSPAPPSQGSSSVSGGGASSTGGPASGPIAAPTLRRVFTRQVGNVDVRGFAASFDPLPSSCILSALPRFQVEVSTPGMVGMATSEPFGGTPASTGKLTSVSGNILGVQEGDPVEVVTAYVGSGVAKVSMHFAATGTTDTMAPVEGWVALVAEVPSSAKPDYSNLGSLQALSSTGSVRDSVTVREGLSGVLPRELPGCVCPGPVMSPTAPNAGSGSARNAGSGSAVYACATPGGTATSPPISTPANASPTPIPSSTVITPGGSGTTSG